MSAEPRSSADSSPSQTDKPPGTRHTGDSASRTHGGRGGGARQPPETLGRYKIVRELGHGGMGAVYLARDTTLDREVALKLPWIDERDGDETRARFLNEAQAAAKLTQHPNICQVFDFGEADGQPYLAMEYLTGKTLSAFTKPGHLPSQRQAAAIVRKIALAVQAAHEKGLVHRDLKPGNIMLVARTDGQKGSEPKVMDFGLAKNLGGTGSHLTRSGSVLGTPYYMSKEQWMGKEGEIGPASDVYSLGVILYQLLTGALPYDADDSSAPTAYLAQLLTKPQTAPRERVAEIDPTLESLVQRAIATERDARFPTMAAFAEALRQWLAGGEHSVTTGGVAPPIDTEATLVAPSHTTVPDVSDDADENLRTLKSTRRAAAPAATDIQTPSVAGRLGAVLRTGVIAALFAVGIWGAWSGWRSWTAPPGAPVVSTTSLDGGSPAGGTPANPVGPSNPSSATNPVFALNASWAGLLTVDWRDGKPDLLTPTRGTITRADASGFTLRLESPTPKGSLRWDFDVETHDGEFRLNKGVLLDNSWDGVQGERIIPDSRVRFDNAELSILITAPPGEPWSQSTYTLSRDVDNIIPLGSLWSGTSGAKGKRGKVLTSDANGIVVARDATGFTLRLRSKGEKAPIVIEYRFTETGGEFRLDGVQTISGLPREMIGRREFRPVSVTLESGHLEFRYTPEPNDAFGERHYRLDRMRAGETR